MTHTHHSVVYIEVHKGGGHAGCWLHCLYKIYIFLKPLPASNWWDTGTAVSEEASLSEVCQPGAME